MHAADGNDAGARSESFREVLHSHFAVVIGDDVDLDSLFSLFDPGNGNFKKLQVGHQDAIAFFQGLRVTARAATMVQLALAVLGGYGIARLLAVKRTGAEADASAAAAAAVPTVGAAVTAVAMLLTIIEYTNHPLPMTPLLTKPTVLQSWLADQRDIVIAELPMPRADRMPGEDPRYQFLSTFHWQKMVNGYSAFVPPRYFGLMERMLRFPQPAALASLRARGVTHIVIHPEIYDREEPYEMVRRMATSADFTFVGWFPDTLGRAAVFRLLPEP